jgi:glycosyltransferase involved in cell wall biosynthesis
VQQGDEVRPDGQVRLLSVGRLTRVKNHQLVVRALAHLPDRFVLTIAGEGDDLGELRQLAQQLGVGKRIEFLGYRPDIHGAYADADIVVHPSLGETFGYSLFEAAALGRGVVALDRETARSYIPQYVPGRLASDGPAAFASAVLAQSAEPVRQEDIDRAAAARRADFGSASVVDAWCTLLDRPA